MSRASDSFAKLFPDAPTVRDKKRKRESEDQQVSTVRDSTSSANSNTSQKAQPASLQHESAGHTNPGGTKDNTSHPSPGDDDIAQGESGDLLSGVGSASSLASNASSIFSNAPAMTSSTTSTTNPVLTPITSTEYSPPGKRSSSPRHTKTAHEHMPTATSASHAAASASSQHDTASATSLHTPPEELKQALPGPGEVKGSKCIFDPDLKFSDSTERKKYKVKYKTFGDQVRWQALELTSIG